MRLRETFRDAEVPWDYEIVTVKIRELVKKIRGKCGVKLIDKSCDLWKRKPATPASAQQEVSQRKHWPHSLPPSVPADDPIG